MQLSSLHTSTFQGFLHATTERISRGVTMARLIIANRECASNLTSDGQNRLDSAAKYAFNYRDKEDCSYDMYSRGSYYTTHVVDVVPGMSSFVVWVTLTRPSCASKSTIHPQERRFAFVQANWTGLVRLFLCLDRGSEHLPRSGSDKV